MPRRRPPEPDLTPFEPIVQAALRAFALDSSYAVEMATRAVIIIEKRATWDSRKVVRAAEVAARQACSDGEAFVCSNTAPCGVGTLCRYSTGALRKLELPDGQQLRPNRGGRAVQRPQLGPAGEVTYSDAELAVVPHRDQREASLRPA